ncbi:choice-of-anchor J domain-containing protein, partial [Flavobacterium limnosediminis]|uniref:choice-of-anchor J domain-containing protein n=1 Tax=Flavobacterium limnosediminis TaxID=1401027 RepID=UPI000555475C
MKKITLVIFMLLLSLLGFAQLPEGFESGIPATWSVSNNGVGPASQDWVATNSATYPAHGGTQHALANRGSLPAGATSENWLVTPSVAVPTNGQLRFWTRMTLSGDNGTFYQLRVSTTSQTNQASFTTVQQWTETQLETAMLAGGSTAYNVYGEIVQSLSAYGGQNIYLAFVRVNTNTTAAPATTGDRWLIDDINIVQQCQSPIALNATSVTSTTAQLSWTNVGPATSWDIEMVASPGTPTGIPTVTGVTNPYIYPGLTPGTQYNFYVRSVCGPGNTSPWTGPFIFNTIPLGQACSGPIPVTTLPYTHTSNTGLYGDVVDGSPGASCGITGNFLNGNDVFYSFTPSFTGIVDISMTPTGNNSGVFVYSSCATVGTTCLAGAANTTGGVRNIPNFNVTAGTTYYIVISTSGTPQTIPYILNIQQVNCAQPTALTAVPTQTNATLGWTSTFANFEYVVQPAGTGLPLGSGTPNAGTSVTTPSTLTSNTQYEFYVRADCGGGLYSIWAGPFTFRTLCGPIAVPFFEGFNSDSTTQICWTVANVGADANAWNMDYATTPYEGNQSASIVSSLATNDDWLMSPQLILNGNQRVRYRYRVSSATSPCNFEIKVSTTGTDPANFMTTILPQASYSNVTYLEKTVNMVGISGNVTIGWHVAPGANGSRIFIDAVIVEDIPACPEPMDIAVSGITPNSASINWTPGGTESSWQVVVQPAGSPAPTLPTQGTTVNTPPPFVATPLLGSTTYDVYVLANCGANGPSVWTGPVTFTTLVAPPVCGGTFVDSGGSTANYANNEDLTWTVFPVNAGDVVTVTFTSFNTQANNDALYVFNGNTTAAPQFTSVNGAGTVPGGLAGGYWGTAIPGPFTSSAADGSLTFRFRSSSSTVAAGWVANVTCAPRPTCAAPISLSQSGVTHNSVNLAWNGGDATAWEVIAVPCGSPRPTAATAGWVPAPTNPFTLPGLTGSTCYDFYVRGICSTTDASAVTGPVSATTQITPPQCGGTFTDAGGPTANYANSSDITWTICPTNPGDVVTVTFTSFDTEANWDALYVFDGNSIAAPQLASTNGAGNVPGGLAGGYWGTAVPGPFTSSSTDGCLTFRFRSDTSGIRAGWVANVTCAPPPTCPKPSALTVTQVTSTSALLGWTEASTATQWQVLVLPAGSPVPAPGTTGTVVNSNPALITGLNPSTAYTFFVSAICSPTDASYWSNGLNFTTAPANDECASATFVPVNANAFCNQTVPGTLSLATGSVGTPIAPCLGTADDDVWYQFIASNTYLNVSLQNVVGSTTNLNFAVYSGTCAGLTQVFCSAANQLNGTLNALTVGQTYYIRVYSNAATPQTTTFNVCISTPSTCPTASTVCNITYGNTTGVTSLGTIGCLSSSPNPTYFTIQVGTTGPINFELTQSSPGSATPNLDVDYAAWGPFTSQAAGCAAGIPFIPPVNTNPSAGNPQDHGCSYSAAPIEQFNIPNAQAGQYYIILITNFSNQTGTISLNQINAGTPGAGTTICCPDANFSYNPRTYCKGTSANPVATIATGSFAGTFSCPNPALVFVNTATGEVNLAATPAGNYIIYNTLAATATCAVKTYSYVITIVEPIVATIAYAAPAYCNNLSGTQAVTVTGASGGTFSVSPVGLLINANTGAITPVGSVPGTYTVSYNFPTSTGCGTTSFTTAVTINAAPNSAPTVVQPTCTTPTGTITVLPTGATYEYSIDGGTTYVATNVFSGLLPNTYNVVIRDTATGCTSVSTTATVNALPNAPTAPTVALVQPTCIGGGQITVTAPVDGPATYSDLFISEVTDSNAGALTYIEIYNGTGATVNLTNYRLKLYNNGGAATSCDFALTGTVANNAVRIIAVGSATNQGGVVPHQVVAGCGGVNVDDNIRLTDTAGNEIDNWGRRDGIAFTPNNLPGYTYRRLQTASAPSNSWNPADWDALNPEVYTNVGSYTPATVSYQYSIDGTTYQASNVFTNVPVGTYNVTVLNVATGCISTVTLAVLVAPTAPVAPTATATSPTTCAVPTGSITVSAPIGANYEYSLDGTTFQAGVTFSTLLPGTYNVVVRDVATGCISTATTLVVDPAPGSPSAPIATVTVQPTCIITTGTIVITAPLGGTLEYTLDGVTYQTNTTFGGLASGTYTVSVRDTASGCISTTTTLVVNPIPANPAAPTASVTVQPNCITTTGTIVVTAPTGGTLEYSLDGVTYQTSATFAGLTPGTYNVTVRDTVTGCVSSATMLVVDPIPANPNAPSVTIVAQPTCAVPSGTIEVTAPLGANYEYSVNGTTYQSGVTFAGLTPGSYNVTVRDTATGCVSSITVVVIDPTPASPATPSVNVTVQPTCDAPTASIEITAPLGAGYEYSLDAAAFQAGVTFTGLAVGTHIVTVRDIASGCTSQASIEIIGAVIPDAPGLVVNTQPVCNDLTGSIEVLSPLGAGYEYSLNGGVYQSNPVFTGLNEAIYTVSVRVISTGCISQVASIDLQDAGCEIPRGISPNGDGKNDAFDLSSFNITKLSIFNRYGVATYTYGSGYTD